MNRRRFMLSIPTAVVLPGVAASARDAAIPGRRAESVKSMTFQQHRDELRNLLFNEYLPFWDHGGYDRECGGFMCNLTPEGVPVDDEKFIWYQGRAIWVYSFLYNNLVRDARYLEIASRTRDFMVQKMYLGKGQWAEKAHRDGSILKGVGLDSDIYGWLFAAIGLIEYYKCSGNNADLQLAIESITAAQKAYDSPQYRQGTKFEGLRIQGHSMIFVQVLAQLLQNSHDAVLGKLLDFHLDNLMIRFYNPDYRIANEELAHDYSRIQGKEGYMFLGHSLEAQWMVMQTALWKKDGQLFDSALANFKRFLEMGWDHSFDGWGSEYYNVFAGPDHSQGPDFSTKTMWAHTEILIGCMIAMEHTEACWASEWYERTWNYIKKTFCRGIGAWEQAVNRYGEPISREKWGIHPLRRCNYHQPRFLMMNILSLERMIKR
jgi:N-acylglucosamine 2-epimerase